MSSRQLVGLHTRDALDKSGVDERLTFSPEELGLANAGIGCQAGYRFTRSQPSDNVRRTDDEY